MLNSTVYEVYDTRNSQRIVQTATIQDALMMVSLAKNRSWRQVKYLSDQVIDIIPTIPLELPPLKLTEAITPDTLMLNQDDRIPL